MLTTAYIQTLWQYNWWAQQHMTHCLESISQDTFERHVPYSIGSLKVQTVHVMWAEELWLRRIQEQGAVMYTAADFADRAAINAHWITVRAAWRDYLAHLTEDELDRVFVTHSRSRQKDFAQSVRETLVHVVNHGTDHRAQMLRIVHDAGGETFEQDMIYFFREQRAT